MDQCETVMVIHGEVMPCGRPAADYKEVIDIYSGRKVVVIVCDQHSD